MDEPAGAGSNLSRDLFLSPGHGTPEDEDSGALHLHTERKSHPGAPREIPTNLPRAGEPDKRTKFATMYPPILRQLAEEAFDAAQRKEAEAGFEATLGKLRGDTRTYLDLLVDLYNERVDERIVKGNPNRQLRTLRFYAKRGTAPAQLRGYLRKAEQREPWNIASQVSTVYANGFGVLGVCAADGF